MRSRVQGRLWSRAWSGARLGLPVVTHTVTMIVVMSIVITTAPLFSATAKAQEPASAPDTLTFTLDRPGDAAVHYSLQLDRATRGGTYRGAGAAATPAAAGARPVTTGATEAAKAADMPITVSESLLTKLFAAGPLVRSNRCASHRKNIAQTGMKTLRLVQNGVVSECTYNYSEDDRVDAATTAFEALAETMQAGERLAAKLRFDRLGLDAEMDNLQTALNEGRALEVGNIAPMLVAIQNDERVMDRVRRKAAHLLQGAGLPSAPPA